MPPRVRATRTVDSALLGHPDEGVPPDRMQPKRSRRPLKAGGLGLALVGVGLLAAACGSGPASMGVASLGSTSTTSASGVASGSTGGTGVSTSAQLQYAECMQTHGVPNWPEPGPGAVAAMRKADFSTPQFKAALKTCRAEVPQVGETPSTPLPQKVLAEALKYTQCMRSHGVPNWPEPTSTYYVAPPSGSEATSPAVQRAARACHALIPERS